MSNFKFIKRASFVLFLFVGVFWSSGAVFAGFVSTSVQDDEKNFNAAAAAIEAVPAKTDGEIVDCFDYYRFPSIQTSFEPLKEFYEPGQTVYFKGELINKNNYPIADGYLFVRIARFNENYVREGHDIADEFFANSGPQGREKFYLDGGERKKTVFNWNAPENLPEGVYVASFSFAVGKKMNLAGLSFTNEIDAGSIKFEVRKSATGDKRVFLEKSSFAVNGKKYDHIGLWPRFDKSAKVEVFGKLKNEMLKKENVKLVYDLYYWDGLDDKNKISSQSEEITVASNSSRSFKYVIPKMNETVYFLRIAAIAGNGQKSIVNLRLVSEQEKPRINFFSPLKFPVLQGETMTNFACFHNTADKSAQGKVTMNVFDESGDKIQTLGYEGKITGNIMAVKKDMVASKNYNYLKMTASVSGADGRETDSYEIIYDCKNMNPENKECAKIQEEKTAAGASGKPFDKKDMVVGIIALAAIMAVAALARKFFINKAKPPLMFLLFALAVSSAVFLAGGANNRVLAETVPVPPPNSVPVSSSFNFPPGVDCDKNVERKGIHVGPIWKGDPLWICVGGMSYITINHKVLRDEKSDTLSVGQKIKFSYDPDKPVYYATTGANDSPYGEWCDDLANKNCLIYEPIGFIGGNDQATIKDDIDMTWLAVKPDVSMTSDDTAIIECEDMTCTAVGSGSATLTAHIGKVTVRPWIKVYAGKGWEGWRYDYKGDEKMHDIDLDSATLTWKIAVDAPSPTCTASFSPAVINEGESTTFQWNSFYDKNGLVPITCTPVDYYKDKEVSSSGYFSISPEADQTCVVTVSNDKGVATCSGAVEVRVVKIEKQTLIVDIYGEKWTDGTIAGGSVTGTNDFSCVGNKTTDPDIVVGADKLLQTCTKSYTGNANVDLYASPAKDCPASGCGFKKWDGDCSGSNCSFTMDASKTIKAYFKVTQGSNDGNGVVPPVVPPVIPAVIPPDPDTYNLTFKTSGSGSGNATRYAYDDTWGWTDLKTMNNGDTAGIGRDWKFKLVPNSSSGSYFSSWSGCGSVNSDNECILEKNPYPGGDKTVTATFNSSSGTGGGDGGGGGGSLVKAYISAQNTVVSDGNNTVVTWTSDNAASCEQKEGGSDTGWIDASDTTLGNYTTSNFTASGGPRTYKVTCINGSQSADAEVTVNVGDYAGSPSVTIWADPQTVGYKKTAFIQWLSSNVFSNSCLLYSVSDTMNGYLAYFNFPSKQYFGPGNYNAEISGNNSIGQKTGKLAADTTYKIQCGGYGPSFTKVTAQTTVAVAKPVSNFTIANSSGASLVATIVEGLSANSGSLALSLSGEAIGNVNLSASIPAISAAKAQFSSDDGTTWSDIFSVDISAISQVKIRVIKIPGATPAGTYNTAITATDTGTGGKTKKLNVSLRVDRVSSEWKEF